MKKLILAAAMLATPLFATPAAAQDGSAMMAAMFPDPDGDGVTTRDEMLAASTARFEQIDSNKDGSLSADERSAGPGGGRMMARADANGDGFVTRAELIAATGTRFDRIDTNHDGRIDAAEREAARQRMMQMRGGN